MRYRARVQGVLYFPLIDVPDSPWLYRALLYWDDVGTIVPDSWPMMPERLAPHTLNLVQAELIRQALPHQAANEMRNGYEHWLRALNPDIVERRRVRFNEGSFRRIHYDKWMAMGSGLDATEDLGLARVRRRYDWIDVETQTAAEFMAALALALCHPASDFSRDNAPSATRWVPASDQPDAVAAMLSGLDALQPNDPTARELRLRVQGEVRASQIRTSILERCLPVPEDSLIVDDILSFRRRHHDALPRFRRYLEARVDEALQYGDPVLHFRALDRIAEEIEELTAQVEAYLRESGIRRIRRSGLLRILKVVPGLSGPIEAAQETAAVLATAPDVTGEPLAYLAFARAELRLASAYGPAPGALPLAQVFAS